MSYESIRKGPMDFGSLEPFKSNVSQRKQNLKLGNVGQAYTQSIRREIVSSTMDLSY